MGCKEREKMRIKQDVKNIRIVPMSSYHTNYYYVFHAGNYEYETSEGFI